MLDINVTGDGDYQSFATPQKDNCRSNALSKQVMLGSDQLKFHHNITTYITHQKLIPSRKDYFCFQTDSRTSQAEQCAISRTLTKVCDTILSIGSANEPQMHARHAQ